MRSTTSSPLLAAPRLFSPLLASPRLRSPLAPRRSSPRLRRSHQHSPRRRADRTRPLLALLSSWFTQVRGYKELILFPQSQAPLLPLNDKYDPGGYPCAIDITDVAQMPPEQRRLFEQARRRPAVACTPPGAPWVGAPRGSPRRGRAAPRSLRTERPESVDGPASDTRPQARGWYVRLGPGDSLFVPKRTFHAVVSLTPSISISAFGHSPADLVTGGVPLEVRDFLHRIGLWRWGSCSCHEHSAARPLAGPCAVLGIGAALVAGCAHATVPAPDRPRAREPASRRAVGTRFEPPPLLPRGTPSRLAYSWGRRSR